MYPQPWHTHSLPSSLANAGLGFLPVAEVPSDFMPISRARTVTVFRRADWEPSRGATRTCRCRRRRGSEGLRGVSAVTRRHANFA